MSENTIQNRIVEFLDGPFKSVSEGKYDKQPVIRGEHWNGRGTPEKNHMVHFGFQIDNKGLATEWRREGIITAVKGKKFEVTEYGKDSQGPIWKSLKDIYPMNKGKIKPGEKDYPKSKK